MTKEWYTARELIGIPGMPATVQGVRYRAKMDSYKAQKCADGKGSEWHISSFPAATRGYLEKQNAETVSAQMSDHAAGAKAFAALAVDDTNVINSVKATRDLLSLSEPQRKKVDARLLIIAAADAFMTPYKACLKGEVGRAAFVEAYAARQLDLPASVYQEQPAFSAITLRRWQDRLETEGPASLAGKYRPVKESSIDRQDDLAKWLTALITAKPHLSSKWNQIHELAGTYAKINGLDWDVPSPSTLRRWLSNWLATNKVAWTFATNPDKYNNQYRTAIESTYPWISAPNDVWEFDSSPVDAMCEDGRHSIIAVIDVFTRRVKLLVSKSSSSQGICLLLRKTLLSWGMLNAGGIMRTDNGSDYVSSRVMKVATLLQFDVSRSNAFSGWEKPFIERFFRTLSHGMIELLPTYIGHNVADRSVIEARRSFAQRLAEKRKDKSEQEVYRLGMTAAELQELLDKWVDAMYLNRKHSGIDMTPNEAYQAAKYSRTVVEDEQALDLLLNAAGTATVSKGYIKVNNLRYAAPELMDHEWKAQKVEVFLDPADIGRAILYRVGDWATRVEAINTDLIGKGVSPDAYRAAKRADAKALSAFRREMKNLATTFGIDDLHKDVVDHFVNQAKDIAQFRRGDTPINNGVIDALTGAIGTNEPPAYSEQELELLAAKKADMERKAKELEAQRGLLLRDEHDKARWLAEQSLIRELTDRETSWLEGYKKSNRLNARNIEKIMAGLNQSKG